MVTNGLHHFHLNRCHDGVLMKTVWLSVFNLVGEPICADPDSGKLVYAEILKALNAGAVVQLSFLNVEVLIPTFLSEALGHLYKDYPQWDLSGVEILDLPDKYTDLLHRTMEGAKTYWLRKGA